MVSASRWVLLVLVVAVAAAAAAIAALPCDAVVVAACAVDATGVEGRHGESRRGEVICKASEASEAKRVPPVTRFDR